MGNNFTRVHTGRRDHAETLTGLDRMMIGEPDAVRGGIAGRRALRRKDPAGLISSAERTRPERSKRTKTIVKTPGEQGRFPGPNIGICEGTRICRL
jgi:hypothetical protein